MLGLLEVVVSPITFLYDTTGIEKGVLIKRKYLNLASRYWFDFISTTMMPYINKAIFPHPNTALLGCIVHKDRLNLRFIIM